MRPRSVLRRFRLPVAVLTAGVTLAACSSSGTGSSASSTSTPAAPSATSSPAGGSATSSVPAAGSSVTTGAPGSAGPPADGQASAVVPWAASGQAPDSTVTVCQFAGPEFDAIQKFGTEFTAMTGGKIKIKMVSIPINQNLPVTINQIRTSSTCDLVDAGAQQAADLNPYLMPLSTFMNDSTLFNAKAYNLDDFPKAVQTVSSDAKNGLMSLTYGSDVQMLYYRKDLMAQWGITVPAPPAAWTWEQFEAALQTVQGKIKAANLSMSPIAISGTQDAGSSMFATTAMWAYGGSPFNGNDPNFTDPKAVEGLTHWNGLLNTLKVANPGSPTYAYNELLTSLQQGKTAMAVEWNAAASTLADPKLSPQSAGKLGYALLPYQQGLPATTPRIFPTTHSLGLSAKSQSQKAAFEFAAWYTSPQIAKAMVSAGMGSSGRFSVLTDPAIVAKQPVLATVGASVQLYHALPAVPSFGDLLLNVMAPQVNAMFTGQKSAQQAAADMQTGALNLAQKSGK